MSFRNIDALLGKCEVKIIIILCGIAAIRIFFFSAAFPFFCVVDEHHHFDMVFKYSHGYLPYKGSGFFDPQSAQILAFYGTSEYVARPEKFADQVIPPPLCAFTKKDVDTYLPIGTEIWKRKLNREAFSPPLYYSIAGLWYNFGKLIGMNGIYLLYWIRFLNVFIGVLLLGFSYLFVKRFYADNLLLRIGVPLMLAFFPQDFFYYINNDVLAPLGFIVAFYLLLEIYFTSSKSFLFYFLAGISTAAIFFIKHSNMMAVAVCAVVIFLKIKNLYRENQLKAYLPKILLLVFSAVLPIVFLLSYNYFVLGDISASAAKIKALTWSLKPLNEIGHHPIFSLQGMITFCNELMQKFWGGEILWHGRILSLKAADIFYSVSSWVFIAAAGVHLFVSRKTTSKSERFISTMCFALLILSGIFLAGMSVAFDFGNCFYPSRAHPYCTSGRLVSAALIPFLILYLTGVSVVLKKIINPLVVVFAIVVSITYSEILITRNVFMHKYNWYNFRVEELGQQERFGRVYGLSELLD